MLAYEKVRFPLQVRLLKYSYKIDEKNISKSFTYNSSQSKNWLVSRRYIHNTYIRYTASISFTLYVSTKFSKLNFKYIRVIFKGLTESLFHFNIFISANVNSK